MRIFIFLLILPFYGLQAQQESTFPSGWEGDWTGTLNIFKGKTVANTVQMSVEIHKIDSSSQGRYTFGLVYGSKDKDYRPYELVPIEPEKGLWAVDEKNSIIMESYMHGPKLLCWFVVEGSRVLCTYEKTDEKTLVFEVMAGQEKEVSKTGDSTQGTEVIPPVLTYPFSTFQRAILKRS